MTAPDNRLVNQLADLDDNALAAHVDAAKAERARRAKRPSTVAEVVADRARDRQKKAERAADARREADRRTGRNLS